MIRWSKDGSHSDFAVPELIAIVYGRLYSMAVAALPPR